MLMCQKKDNQWMEYQNQYLQLMNSQNNIDNPEIDIKNRYWGGEPAVPHKTKGSITEGLALY